MQDSNSNVGKKTVSGASWITMARVGQQVVSFVSSAAVARILGPSTYGIFGMAAVITGFIAIFRGLGTGPAVVQRKELTPKFLASIGWANVLFGLSATGIGMAVSPLVGWAYREPKVSELVFWMSIGFTISGLAALQDALLLRRMEFGKIAIIEITSTITASVVSVTMALNGFGLWSLVGSSIAYPLVSSTLFIIFCRVIPPMMIDLQELRSVMQYSLSFLGANVLTYFGRNSDNFLIGRYLGAAPLGFYQSAYNIMLVPLQNISHPIARVLGPALARLQDDNERFSNAYLSSCSVIAMIAFPCALGMLAVADPLVAIILGPAWAPVAMILSVLAPVGMMQSVLGSTDLIYMCKGRTDLLLRMAILTNAILFAVFAICLRWGVLGVAIGYAVANICLAYFLLRFAFRLIGLSVGRFVTSLAWCLQYALLMLAAVAAMRIILASLQITSPVSVLACSVSTGVIVYCGLLILLKPRGLLLLVETGLFDRVPGVVRLFGSASSRADLRA
jgi:PST family polysaccharide transporter